MSGIQHFLDALKQIESGYDAAFASARDEHHLRELNAQILGPAGSLQLMLKHLSAFSVEEKKLAGQNANQLKKKVQEAFDAILLRFEQDRLDQELQAPGLDLTLPWKSMAQGRKHPLMETLFDVLEVFKRMGFDIHSHPEVDKVEFNFSRLGFPDNHPAMDMQDSFFVGASSWVNKTGKERYLLRTHTTQGQVHELLKRKPPMAGVSYGPVYRRDDDATHSPMFFQVDGFYVDKNVTFADLKGTLATVIEQVFGPGFEVRFRPSYFPFVEPGAEVDIGKRRPDGSMRWMEILGCGMIHPTVFQSCGYDANEWTGFAFGMGIDRITMLRHGITSIRALYDNDPRFLSQF